MGPIHDTAVIKVKRTKYDRALKDSNPVYLAWPTVLAIFSEAGWWNDSKQPVGGIAVIPIKTRSGVEAYAANGFSELREVLEWFNHHLPKQSSEPAGRSQASTAEQTFVSWVDGKSFIPSKQAGLAGADEKLHLP